MNLSGMEARSCDSIVIPMFLPPFLDDETKNQKTAVVHQESDDRRVHGDSGVQEKTQVPYRLVNNDFLGPGYLKKITTFFLFYFSTIVFIVSCKQSDTVKTIAPLYTSHDTRAVFFNGNRMEIKTLDKEL